MDATLFDRLLYEEESPTLDFKREQYRFVKASDEDKSELLKDILGFANAWRRSEAYILIGVEDVRGGRSNVVGIAETDHLDDHSLQQFVNNLTNKPVHFHYEAFGCEGKQVGIIRIDDQQRPIYLKRDYGKLRREKVYVRRGSWTDPTKPASPEEIAQMGPASVPETAELVVEFADVERDASLGSKISWDAEYCQLPNCRSIPDLLERKYHSVLGREIDLSVLDIHDRINENYYRELATYEFHRRLFHPVRFVVRNAGQVSAKNVRTELTVVASVPLLAKYPSDMPKPPKKRHFRFGSALSIDDFRAARGKPGEVTIDKNDERTRLEIDCGDLQPGRRVWSEIVFVAFGGEADIDGQVFAENLPEPKDYTLTVSANITKSQLGVSELLELPEHEQDDDP